jgi:hypothetical protein
LRNILEIAKGIGIGRMEQQGRIHLAEKQYSHPELPVEKDETPLDN